MLMHPPPFRIRQLSCSPYYEAKVELFEILDVDSSGSLNLEEYLEGITKLVTSELPLEQLRMQKCLNIVRADVKELADHSALVEDLHSSP